MAESLTPRPADDEQAEWSAREIARRNRESLGKPLSPVMKTAATACELAHGPAAEKGDGKVRDLASAAPRRRSVPTGC